MNGLALEAVIIGPGDGREEVPIPQTGPGLYEGSFRADRVGDYVVTVSAPDQAPRTLGVSRSYSDEYRIVGADARLLDRLAEATGGRRAGSADDDAAIAAILNREPGRTGTVGAAWWWLLAAALVLFALDVAARTLTLSEAAREKLGRLARGRVLLTWISRRRPGFSYEELRSMVARAREQEKRKLRDRISEMASEGKVDPDLAAYLYIARLRRTKAEAREKGE